MKKGTKHTEESKRRISAGVIRVTKRSCFRRFDKSDEACAYCIVAVECYEETKDVDRRPKF